MVQTTFCSFAVARAGPCVCLLPKNQANAECEKDMRFVWKYFLCSDDVSLGSGKNGSFDDRTEGSSLHEGNRWFLMMMIQSKDICDDDL